MEPDSALDDPLDRKFQKELNAGTLSLLLLAVIARARSPLYGYQIAKQLETQAPIIKLGTLYPVLRALEASGLLEGEVEPSVSGPPRKYFRITSEGRKTLKSWIQLWGRTRDSVESVLGGKS
jgi:PadR family transcriptional regulator, regulatory protein PadR